MRRTGMGRWGVALAAAALAACADDPAPVNEVVFEPNAPAGPAQIVARVDSVEIGVMHRGRVVTAFGQADGAGWRDARLRPRTGVAGPDGVIEFELVASPPPAPADGPATRLRADSPLAPEQVAGASGVRVIGAAGAVEATLRP